MSEHTKEPFEREERYIVIKIKDLKYVSVENKLRSVLAEAGIHTREGVVVEYDWPEFDLVWSMIEARITGKGNDVRRIVSCVNACAGLPTEVLHAISEALGTDEGHSSVYWIEQLKAALKTDQEPVASIYINAAGEREFDDWKIDLPRGRTLLYEHPARTLSDEEILDLARRFVIGGLEFEREGLLAFARAVLEKANER